jgi:RNA polymerase nonessential primary-like sigma factor
VKKQAVTGAGPVAARPTHDGHENIENMPLAHVESAQEAIEFVADMPFEELALSPDVSGEPGDTLSVYLRNVRRTELFTPQEEFDFATRARAGDFAARQSMIEHNLRLVVSIAKGYLGAWCALVGPDRGRQPRAHARH